MKNLDRELDRVEMEFITEYGWLFYSAPEWRGKVIKFIRKSVEDIIISISDGVKD